VRSIKINSICLAASQQIRASMCAATIDEYAEAMVEGEKFPPIICFDDGKTLRLADGYHRVAAAQKAGIKDLLADIRKGGEIECIEFAVGVNDKHGLRRSNADKRNAVKIALDRFPQHSSRQVAAMCKVNHHLVEEMRASKVGENAVQLGDLPTETCASPCKSSQASSSAEMRIGGDGKSYPAQKLSSQEPEKDGIGRAIPTSILALWHRRNSVSMYLQEISSLRGILKQAAETSDPLFAECALETIRMALEDARLELQRAIPYAVCPYCQGLQMATCRSCKGRGFVSEFFWEKCVDEKTKSMAKA
jgi:hypothetical protein